MKKQAASDLTEVLANAEAALKALEPALKKYKRISGSCNYGVASYLITSKSCLQMLITQTRAKLKTTTPMQEACQLDKSKVVATLKARAA